jgi:hypothetical protein
VFTVAESAQKTSAGLARLNGFFLRVIEATRFALHHDGIAGLDFRRGAKQGRVNFNL